MSHSSGPGFLQRSVVSSFIFLNAERETKVALFKRSNKVSTYRHCLAPISGYIEQNETPITAAWREIREETSLNSHDVNLWRKGKPYSFSDPSVGRQWTIYPFSFRLVCCDEGGRGGKGIQIDWEHESWGWYNPESIKDDEQFGGVPRLEESLGRVWFEGNMNEGASKALIAGLEQLKADHQSGFNELTLAALRTYQDVITQMQPENSTKWWETARMVVWHLWKNGREDMGSAILNPFLELLAEIQGILHQSLDRGVEWECLQAALSHHIQRQIDMPTRIQNSFAAYVQSKFVPIVQSKPKASLNILTLSASSNIRNSVLDAFAAVPIPDLDLRILESRPLYEGVSMGSSIISAFQNKFPGTSEKHLKMTIYTDASAALASKDVDLVLLGADRISDCGAINNKTGSLPAILSAKHISPNSKLLILTALEKIAGYGVDDDHNQELNDPKRVMDGWLDAGVKGVNIINDSVWNAYTGDNCVIKVNNIFSEWVPAGLVDAYICAEGTLDVSGIEEKAEQVKQNIERYFGGL
ncbi:hypothetical protein N7508_008386 [Penicillium antarcticum]|uniref:uncharacterized protein n=1 Tax=Penicillium antarcticum TaxID=416450 RepID=UPI0023A225B7|nr:uncharacterized protein N7508_008386 [Penicillium antarcticum]KAJ5293565.1 hypothetical protein N7508_008386 [Penicillium antarcticum]